MAESHELIKLHQLNKLNELNKPDELYKLDQLNELKKRLVMKVFECQLCGECCYGEGGIYVTAEEVARIADFLGRAADRFLDLFCDTRNGRLYLETGSDNYCIFFDKEKMCLIHPVKPARCIQWPFFEAIVEDEDNWDLAKDACPGIRRDCTHDAFVDAAARAGFPPAARGHKGK